MFSAEHRTGNAGVSMRVDGKYLLHELEEGQSVTGKVKHFFNIICPE